MNGRGKASSSRSCCNQTAVAGIVDAGSKRPTGITSPSYSERFTPTGITDPGYNTPCSRRPVGGAHASHSSESFREEAEAATTTKENTTCGDAVG